MSDEQDQPAKRLRGRLASGVTVWTAGEGREATGLTVASALVTEGEPPRVLGTVGDLAELLDAVRATGCFVVHLLGHDQRQLADRFAGLMPVPGGPLRDVDTRPGPHGPVLSEVGAWAGCRLVDERQVGYPILLEGAIEELALDDLEDPLVWFRGQYRRLGQARAPWQATGPDSALPDR